MREINGMKRKILAVTVVLAISIAALNVVNNTQTNGIQLGNVEKSDSTTILDMSKPPTVIQSTDAPEAKPAETKVDAPPPAAKPVETEAATNEWIPKDPPLISGEARAKALACPPDFRGKVYWTEEAIMDSTTQEQFSVMLKAAKAKNNIVPNSSVIIEDIIAGEDGKQHSLIGAGSESGGFDLISRTDTPEPGYPACLDESMLNAIRITDEDGNAFKKSKYFYNPDKPRESVLLVTTHEG